MILNKALCCCLIHRLDHYEGRLGFFYCHMISAYSSLICSACFFHQSQEKKREWISKQCQKLRSKVKRGFSQISKN